MVIKMKNITFTHQQDFRGEVEIAKGGQIMKVPVDDLKNFVAEAVRFDLANHIQKMKPADLLRRIA